MRENARKRAICAKRLVNLGKHQVTTICGRFVAASSELNKHCGPLDTGFFRTSVTLFLPAAFSALRKFVRFHSTHAPAVPATFAVACAVVETAGRLFHVS